MFFLEYALRMSLILVNMLIQSRQEREGIGQWSEVCGEVNRRVNCYLTVPP